MPKEVIKRIVIEVEYSFGKKPEIPTAVPKIRIDKTDAPKSFIQISFLNIF
ncbi:MAG: hypothetical protein JRJ27_22095 [Deltaproteobacteria bacterium]|nr:hypothetical protein [Deltaproteobacteria bacterium]